MSKNDAKFTQAALIYWNAICDHVAREQRGEVIGEEDLEAMRLKIRSYGIDPNELVLSDHPNSRWRVRHRQTRQVTEWFDLEVNHE